MTFNFLEDKNFVSIEILPHLSYFGLINLRGVNRFFYRTIFDYLVENIAKIGDYKRASDKFMRYAITFMNVPKPFILPVYVRYLKIKFYADKEKFREQTNNIIGGEYDINYPAPLGAFIKDQFESLICYVRANLKYCKCFPMFYTIINDFIFYHRERTLFLLE